MYFVHLEAKPFEKDTSVQLGPEILVYLNPILWVIFAEVSSLLVKTSVINCEIPTGIIAPVFFLTSFVWTTKVFK